MCGIGRIHVAAGIGGMVPTDLLLFRRHVMWCAEWSCGPLLILPYCFMHIVMQRAHHAQTAGAGSAKAATSHPTTGSSIFTLVLLRPRATCEE